ncbi:hypothetical protein [Methylocystis parvus]|uniref:hypothetical protein n=1 Tax=Methylocystis parvus TaxID=134 RepID=UPI003C74D5F7
MEDDFYLDRPLPHVLRAVLGAVGLLAILAPAWEFRHAFLHPGWFSLFFGVITLGAWAVGGSFLLIAVVGEDQRWRVGEAEIEIERRNLFRRWTTRLRPGDVVETAIKETEWDSRANTFGVALTTRDGATFETAGAEKRATAEAIERRLRQALGLAVE